jgi:hypothetical protein
VEFNNLKKFSGVAIDKRAPAKLLWLTVERVYYIKHKRDSHIRNRI